MEKSIKKTLSNAEINWIITALQHDVAEYYTDLENAKSSATKALANLAIENRESLITKLNDWRYAEFTNIVLTH